MFKLTVNQKVLQPEAKLWWQIFQGSVLVLPLFPALGELGLFLVLLGVWRRSFAAIAQSTINRGWLVLSLWLVINSGLAYQSQEAWLGLANFVPFFGLFAAVSNLINSFARLKILAWLLVIPSIPIVILGLLQLYFNASIPSLLASILGWELVPLGIPEGRMSSVFIYANFLAIYLSFSFILSLGLWLDNWFAKKPHRIRICLISLILVSNFVGLILANSRNSWLIVFLACLSFALYLSWYWLVSLITAAIAVIFGASFGKFQGQQWLRKIVPEFIWGRLSDQMYPDRPIETLRITQWQFCWLKIKERPIMGWGLRNFTPLYLEQTNYWFGHPHNLFIMLGLEIGAIATLFLCLIVGYILSSVSILLCKPQKLNINAQEHLILFTYLITFLSCVLFNIFDVSIFDLRVNTISWIILSAIAGIVQFLSKADSKTSPQ